MLHVIESLRPRLTVREAVELCGLKTYDGALPQDWVDSIPHPRDREIVLCGVVWCYDGGSIFGFPAPITPAAHEVLVRLDAANGSHYSDHRDFTVVNNKGEELTPPISEEVDNG